MATRPSRYRSSTSASNPPPTTKAFEVLQSLLHKTSAVVSDGQTTRSGGYPDIQALLKYSRQLHQHIAATPAPCPAQDDFRHLRGYQHLLDLLKAFSGFYDPQRRTESEKKALFEFLHIILAVLSVTFREHSGNRQYFRYRVQGGGWDSLEQIIASIGLGGSDNDPWTYAQLFGKLLSFALDDQRLDDLCQSVVAGSTKAEDTPAKNSASPDDDKTSADDDTEETKSDEKELQQEPNFDMATVDKALADIVGPKTVLHNPEIMRAVVGFWESMPRIPEKGPDPTSLLVLATLSSVTTASFFNLSALHGTGVLSRFLWLYFSSESSLSDAEKERLLPLCKSMMYLGVNRLSDAQFLLANRDVAASEFCLGMAEQYNGPPFVQFDLSLHGHSSIELPNLGRPFPPLSTNGYTFTCWVRIDRFDPKSHTTLFGIFDSSQTCFLLAYLEKDTRNFILQTSVTSQRPSVRFKSVAFQENRWYHIALVHRKPKAMTSSKASLYVNGEFAEQIRSSYPIQPPMSAASAESFASFSSNTNKTNPVQAFLGTPRDLSTQIGPGLIFSKWSLASAHLFEDILSDDFLAVHYRLSPRYQGNFQDCLGGFQTYEASAALGLRNEVFHPGKEEHSDILKAIRDKASTIIPEQRVLMGITPSAMFRTGGSFVDSSLFRSLSRNAANQLLSLTTKSGTAIAMNAALPCINDALVRAHGVAILTGDPVLSTPSYFDDNLWRLGGFTPVALKMIERTGSADELVRTVELMFLCINKSWRNSEAMERDNGYAILAMLLQAKLGYSAPSGMDHPEWRLTLANDERDRLSFQLLSLVLAFIGYKHTEPLESFIINPLAYRILLIDFDTWRKAAPITQELYYKQFVTFAVMSKYHQFNSRRLLRMRIIKRLLDAMKAETMSHDILPHFMSSFESLIKCNYNAEVHRSLALFITYAFHTPAGSRPRTPRPFSNLSRSSTPGLIRRPAIDTGSSISLATMAPSKVVTKKQLGAAMLEMYTRLLSEKGNVADIRKFARTVTNKVTLSDWHWPRQVLVLTSTQWLLYLLAEDDPSVVVCGCRILARLLVTHGSGYTSKFASKTGGFTIMAHRLKHWWDVKELWVILWCLLFGKDVAEIDVEASWPTSDLVKMFEKTKVSYPDALPVIVAMLQQGLRDVMKYQDDPDSPTVADSNGSKTAGKNGLPEGRPRAKSAPVAEQSPSRRAPGTDKDRIQAHKVVLQSGIHFLAELHSRSSYFRDFALSSDYVRLLLSALYPVIVSADAVSPETELHSKNSALTFDGGDVMIRPVPGSKGPAPIVRTSHVAAPEGPSVSSLRPPRGTPLRKASSFILLTSQESSGSSPVKLAHVLSPKKQVTAQQANNSVLEGILDLVIGIFVDQVMTRKEFPGFGLFTKVPPGFKEHQAYFESYVLRTVLGRLTAAIQTDQKLLCEPRILNNMARFVVHMTECSSEGWFMNGAEAMLDYTGQIMEYLQRSDISSLKSVRLCSQAVSTIRISFLKLVLLRLSDMDDLGSSESQALAVLTRIFFWQTVLLGCLQADDDFMKLLWYQLYSKLLDTREPIRLVAASIWRVMLVQMPDESSAVFRQCATPDQMQLIRGFSKLTEVDDGAFVEWIDQHRPSLDVLFFSSMSKSWEDFVAVENQRTLDSARSRVSKRKDRLKHWLSEGKERENVLLRHEMANSSWMKSIYVTEHFKHQRVAQDHQDDFVYLTSTFAKMDRDLRRPGSVFAEPAVNKWKLDRTEGRNRMRLRILPDYSDLAKEYQSKRKVVEATAAVSKLSLDTKVEQANAGLGTTPLSGIPPADSSLEDATDADVPSDAERRASASDAGVAPEEDFEFVDDPNEPDGDDAFEDKNRKVMRRLEHGDAVQSVYNICRIIGLETCEGILIIGKEALYLMDNVFQCQDGEIVNVWQAPIEERDPFSQIVAFAKPGEKDKRTAAKSGEQESRSWRWTDVISISKRRFLFRDVAIEIFFRDGRSYLLTALDPQKRDEVYGKLMTKTPHTAGPNSLPNPEDIWRLEALKVFEETPQTFGSKFGSIFNSSPWNPLMRRWQKGEISNFHYLMLVNTMAGRTFNDLTQYPVFPWVLADYTSEELDLNDPATFRDLSKPMGAQTIQRQSDFIMRYNSLAEIGQPPFHYGTHYSSAMVVSSYLIRLPPFVDSYLLLQGGSFDHPDRLFYSIEGAWKSASRDNGTDVRELTPEFFCLPEFLTNMNGYDFGRRQDGSKVDSVKLPPWAKGDPHIFIAKHREALESPYVSQNLHYWIDLVFGCKQRGEAAVENLNVFHHLSYHGAIDLDNIQDKQERAIVTGIIHNFGQTPHQVFSKSHPHRDNLSCGTTRLDTSVHALTRLPYTLLESHERVASLIYASKLDRLLCASPFRVNYPPFYDKFLEWGFADNSVRFFFTDNRKPAGLFENLHIGQISCLKFADSKTLITAGEDCVVSVYSVVSSPTATSHSSTSTSQRAIELMPRDSLFGHKTPVVAMAVSKALSTLLTVGRDGAALLWDLNRLEFIRRLPIARPGVECARIHDASGEILLCAGQNVLLFSINGELLLDQNVCALNPKDPHGLEDAVFSCAFYEGAGSEWLENYLIFTGHRRGRVNVWRRIVSPYAGTQGRSRWALEFVRALDHVDPKSEVGVNVEAAITCVCPMPTLVYVGDEDGRVYEWNMVRRER